MKKTKCQGPYCLMMIVRRPGKPVAKYHNLICAGNAMRVRREEALRLKCPKCGQVIQ